MEAQPLFTKWSDVLFQDVMISQSREIRVLIFQTLCTLAGTSAATLLPRSRYMSNERTIRSFLQPISRLRDTASLNSYRLANRGPEVVDKSPIRNVRTRYPTGQWYTDAKTVTSCATTLGLLLMTLRQSDLWTDTSTGIVNFIIFNNCIDLGKSKMFGFEVYKRTNKLVSLNCKDKCNCLSALSGPLSHYTSILAKVCASD